MARATGIGSHPGEDERAYEEAVRVVLGELGDPPGVPYVPEVPGRGAQADMVGRASAVWVELGADLQPAGWRLTGGGSGIDQRRARSLLGQDLDRFEEQADGFTGTVKMQIAGPWTLAATVERPRGDRVLGDHGARRDLAAALAAGLAEWLPAVRRRVPGASWVVQVDEPALPAVLAARVPTASGFGRHRTVHPPEASAHLAEVTAAITAAGAEPWVHCCAPDVPVELLTGAGAVGVLVDLAVLAPAAYEGLASHLDSGGTVGPGAVDTTPGAARPSAARATEQVLRWVDMLGLDPEVVGPRLLVTPGCGLAGTVRAEEVLRACRSAAADLP